MIDTHDRHPGTAHLARYFTSDHLSDRLRPTAQACEELAAAMVRDLGDGPELSAGLRHLLEAKDCFVRARLDEAEEDG